MQHVSNIKPEWANHADREIDLSDMWVDYVDPENEDGSEVIGHMHQTEVTRQDREFRDYKAIGFHLDGVSVDINGDVLFYDREWLLKVMGHSAIWKLEEYEMEAA